MVTKTFEIRDRATFIPVLAIKMQPACEADRYLFSRAGFGVGSDQQAQYIMLVKIDGGDCGKATSDPYGWSNQSRTMLVAHDYINKNFNFLNSGDVVCVENILGELPEPKISERLSGGVL